MSPVTRCVAGVAFATIGVASASADIVVQTGPGNFPNDEEVLLNGNLITSGLLVQGETNQTHAVVDFFGAGENLAIDGQGQASIEAADGDFTTMTIALDTPGAVFSTLIFNLDALANGSLQLTVNPTGESPVVNTYALGQNGQNFFRISAINGQTIDSVSFTTSSQVSFAQLEDLAQVRIGGVSGAAAVPLPSAAFSGGGLLAAGAVFRGLRTRKAWRG